MYNVILPELGDGIENATIACFHVNQGDRIQRQDDLLEVVTDKASFNVSAEVDGRIKEIKCQVGQVLPIGATLMIIED